MPYIPVMARQHQNIPAGPTRAMAWNGIRLRVPESWEPLRLGLGYLYFEDGDGPAFEFKWRRGAGRAGMEAALRSLTPKGRATAADSLPDAWLDALTDFELMPLRWARDGRSGLGAALFCPECGMAAVFQGYGGQGGLDAARLEALAGVLESLVHHEPGPPAFAVFGLSFAPPPGYVLSDFAFRPGHFSLSFAAGRRGRLDVLRLAPADVLLGRNDLAAVAGRAFGFTDRDVRQSASLAGCPAVWLASRQGRAWVETCGRFFGRTGRLAVLRHDAGANKLLGTVAGASKPIDRDWLARVAVDCVSL